jgi:hypothetical protein
MFCFDFFFLKKSIGIKDKRARFVLYTELYNFHFEISSFFFGGGL